MQINMLKSKIHRATVTEANLNYVGSITISSNLLKESEIIPYEKVQIVDVNNGARFETYVITSENTKSEICLNGAAARKVEVGDKIIIMSYCMIDDSEKYSHRPKVLFLNSDNEIDQITYYENPGEIKNN